MMGMQMGDVTSTCADISALQRDTGYSPSTPIDVGVPEFVSWYQDFFGTNNHEQVRDATS